MNVNQQLRDELVNQAEAAFLHVTTMLDALYGHMSFLLERYPPHTISDLKRSEEIFHTIGLTSTAHEQLAKAVVTWKQGLPRAAAHQRVDEDVLIELWANMQALVYVLNSRHIDLEPYNHKGAMAAFSVLFRCNRVLT